MSVLRPHIVTTIRCFVASSIRVDMVHKPGSQPQQAGLQPGCASAESGNPENDGMLGTFAPEESIQRQRADIDPFNLPHGSPHYD